jgi:hypothetical protein
MCRELKGCFGMYYSIAAKAYSRSLAEQTRLKQSPLMKL